MTTDAPAGGATRQPGALIDELMPTWDVRERHRTRVRATAEATFAALHTADLSGAPLVRVLLALRALPETAVPRPTARPLSDAPPDVAEVAH